jgi:hypothetical protein
MKTFLPKIGHFLSVEKTYLPRAVAEADQILERWDVPHEIDGLAVADFAPDLDDQNPRWWKTKQGSRISGRLLLNDLVLGGASPATSLLMGLLPLLALATIILGMLPSALGTLGGFIGTTAIACVAVALWRAAGKGIASLATFLGVIIPMAFARSAVGAGAAGFSPMMMMDHLGANASGPTMAIGLVAVAVVVFFAAGSISRARVAFLYVVGLVVLLAVLSAISGVLGHLGAPFAIAPFFLLGAGLPWAWSELDWQHWIMRLHAQDTAAPGESTMGGTDSHMKARRQQAEGALRDKSPLVVIGTATGVFSSRNDNFAPDAGMNLCLSVDDFSENIHVAGTLGSGKTTLLRRLITQWLRAGNFGMLVLDEKDLPGELRGLDRYTLIEPGVKFGLIEGLNPTELTDALFSVDGDKPRGSSNSEFFEASARNMSINANVVTEAMIAMETAKFVADGIVDPAEQAPRRRVWWTVASILSCLAAMQDPDSSPGLIAAMRKYRAPSEGEQHMLDRALDYFAVELPTMDEKQRSGIRDTLFTRVNPLFSSKELVAFAHTERSEGFNLSQILRGGRFGVNLPKVRYGEGGLLVGALVNMRVASLMRRRAGYDWKAAGETRVLGVKDEAAGLVTQQDIAFLKISRSLGYCALFAIQNFDAYVMKFGEAGAQTFLDNFRTKISLTSTPYTYSILAKAIGMTRRLTWTGPSTAVNYAKSLTVLAQSALLDPTHPGASFLRTLLRRGHGFFREASDGAHGFSGHIHRRKEISATEDVFKLNPIQQCESKVMPLLEETDWDSYLAEKFTAVATVQRAGIRRRDIITTLPMFEFPPDLMTGSRVAPDAFVANTRPADVEPDRVPTDEEDADQVRSSRSLTETEPFDLAFEETDPAKVKIPLPVPATTSIQRVTS